MAQSFESLEFPGQAAVTPTIADTGTLGVVFDNWRVMVAAELLILSTCSTAKCLGEFTNIYFGLRVLRLACPATVLKPRLDPSPFFSPHGFCRHKLYLRSAILRIQNAALTTNDPSVLGPSSHKRMNDPTLRQVGGVFWKLAYETCVVEPVRTYLSNLDNSAVSIRSC